MVSKENVKQGLKKFWFLLWKDNSFKGWIFSIIFLFVFIKFIFFPLLSLTTGTSLPLAIVESCSMYHKGNLLSNFDSWWEGHSSKYSSYQLSQEEFGNFIFKKGFNKGDILFVVGANPKKLKIGDVIIFEGGQRNPLIHRIIDIRIVNGTYHFSTMGDNNNGQLSVEKDINENQLIGKAVFKIAPYLGWGKLIFYEPLRSEQERGFCKET
jgi:signal peptidase I